MRRRAERRFHNAARCAEDRAAARCDRKRIVEFFVGQFGELDARRFDHARKLARGDRRVHVAFHFGAVAFVFLRRAGNDRNGVNRFGIDAVLFRPIALQKRAEHLLGRFAGGKVGDHRGIFFLDEFYPTGAAGRKHGHGFARFDAVDQLARLFHDGKVGGDIHVKHVIGTQTADRRDHFALYVRADGHVERFAQRGAHGRRGEEDHFFRGIGKRRPHFVDRRAFGECADGAGDDTLTAAHAHRFGKGHIERAADVHVKASADMSDRVDVLLFASRYAAGAVDALVVIAHDCRRRGIDGQNVVFALKTVFVHAVTQREFLQLAVMVSLARKALFLVLGEEQFERHFTALAALFGVRAHFHAFGYGIDAGGDQTARARRFDDAHTAGTDAVHVFEVAQRGNFDMRFARRFQNGAAFGHGNGNIVDFQIDIFSHLFHLIYAQSL